jgi:ribosomal peptide maturation radical SAM protein 1
MQDLDLAARPRAARSSASDGMHRSRPRTALVSMPFVSIQRPSIQVGLLKAIAVSRGFDATGIHLNLDFAEMMGASLFEVLCQHRGRMDGEWFFSAEAFGATAPDLEGHYVGEYYESLANVLKAAGSSPEEFLRLRRELVPVYLDRMLDAYPWAVFDVVGFTSTFQQNTASFALANRLKARHPHITTLFGGANFEGGMGIEYVRSVPGIDYAIIGEADEAFPEFLDALTEGRDPALVPGVVKKTESGTSALVPRGTFRDLEVAPVPSYEDFFEQAERLGHIPVAPRRNVDLPFESSRGCWWGQKQHCTFCGLNGKTMQFRTKSPAKVKRDLNELARRYRSFSFEAVDNIMNMSYLDELFSALKDSQTDYQFFYEVKSNLSRAKIRILKEGGVRRIQPGIESMSSQVLRLMRKGVRMIQNVNTLRWARYYDVGVGWNVIWGFPGETAEDYERQLKVLAQLRHLEPPVGCGRIWMERFSPIFEDRALFPAVDVQPESSYRFVYPKEVDLDRAAYFFDYRFENALPDEIYAPTIALIEGWKALWKENPKPSLTYRLADDFLQIDDMRRADDPGTYTFEGPLAYIYSACSDRPRSAAELRASGQLDAPEGEIQDLLLAFVERGISVREGDHFLSLALPATSGR